MYTSTSGQLNAAMHDVILLCPQPRDVEEIRAAGLERRFRIHRVGPDLDAVDSFDVDALLDECGRVPADGVVATKDRSALLAALVAARRGLPGPSPAALVRCQHKLTSREVQARAVPAATPRFAPVRAGGTALQPPFFLKPVVGRLSQGARRVDPPDELTAFDGRDGYAEGYAAIAERAGLAPGGARGLIAEELLVGDEVTLEGFVRGGAVTVVGVTDSVKYAGTTSFERFEYPSRLPAERLRELGAVASTLLPALGFDDGFFNVEFSVPASGNAKILEVNGRLASQFAPLYRAVHGRSSYEALLEVACGDDPGWGDTPVRGVAVSYVLRVFEDAVVEAVPDAEPGVEVLVRPGMRLSDQGANDVESYRLAIVYEAGETRDEAVARARERAAALSFRLAPLRP